MSKIKTVKVTSDRENGLQIEVKQISKGIDSFYKEIGCDCIDITPTNLPGVEMIVDDEGRFKADNLPTVFSHWHTYPMVGTVLFVRIDESNDGDTVSLTDDDVKQITESVVQVFINKQTGELHQMLVI